MKLDKWLQVLIPAYGAYLIATNQPSENPVALADTKAFPQTGLQRGIDVSAAEARSDIPRPAAGGPTTEKSARRFASSTPHYFSSWGLE